ncbi:MAG: HD domain-containing protein [bacterium]
MSKSNNNDTYRELANFIYETSIHSKTPRSGLWFLGSGSQSVAEHLFHTTMIAYALAHVEPGVDKNKVVLMALMHDIGEGRTSDHNYVHQRYGRLAEAEAVKDLACTVPFGDEMLALFNEEQAHETIEAKLVKDADQLEWITTLRAEEIKGNVKAKQWIDIAAKRLKTKSGKAMGKVLIKTHPDSWWFNAKDAWFVDRKTKDKKWAGRK